MTRFHRLEFNRLPPQPPASVSPSPSSFAGESDALQQADLHRRAGRFEPALRCYSRALELDRSLAVAWLGQVQMLINLEEYPEAELWSRKAIELFRENGDLMAGRAQALCRLGDLRQALSLSDGALAQRQQSAYRWIVRGEIMLRRKEALEQHCFDKAEQLDADWLVPLEIACIYLHYGQFTRALTRVRPISQRAPEQPYCWYLQGCLEDKLGFTRQAQTSLKRCLELEPKHQEARSRLHEVERGGRRLLRLWRWLTWRKS